MYRQHTLYYSHFLISHQTSNFIIRGSLAGTTPMTL